jgi:Vitamin K-dependent gamma-carboxylase
VNAAAARAPAHVRGVTAAFDDLLGRAVSMRALALLRVLAGPVVLLHLRPFLSDGWDGRIYRDAFYEPYASWYPEFPTAVYVALLSLAAAAAVAMSLGFLTRLATTTTFVIVAYNLFLSTTHFHNNRAYLVIVLGLLAVAPCGRELSVDAWVRRRRGQPAPDKWLRCSPDQRSGCPPPQLLAPAWPLWLLRFECAAVYGASGLSKLVDPDWFGGTVTWQRVVRARDELGALPDWTVSVLTDRSFHTGAAKIIVLTELFIAVGLWWRGTRYAAVWIAVVFHVAIETSASVQVFSYLAIAVLVIWAVPSTRDRVLRIDPTAGPQRRLGAAVRGLDWLARFRVEPAPPGSRPEVVDRDGATIRGAPALALALSRLPLTAWFALPALLLPSVRRARRAGRHRTSAPVATST